ncbi:hypothetical protein [Uliginosibacterium sediminicola]|uniref:Uncharacterized protein n=1 Tax=Uliginosibacterium sediminicola TaxID=2024550 RepID=A0ABU9YYA3_9RHOO
MFHIHHPQTIINKQTRSLLRALIETAAPYALAALLLFMHHEQYFG